jgi:hypothetical protein
MSPRSSDSPAIFARFLGAVDNLKHRVILTICYATGLRVSEAVCLKPAARQEAIITTHLGCWVGAHRPTSRENLSNLFVIMGVFGANVGLRLVPRLDVPSRRGRLRLHKC